MKSEITAILVLLAIIILALLHTELLDYNTTILAHVLILCTLSLIHTREK
jgi:uncharacterized membrane protein YkgB